MRGFGKQSVVRVGKLLAVAASFSVYYSVIGIIVVLIVHLILICVLYGSGAALLFSARTLLPLGVIVGLLVLSYRVIKRRLSKRDNTTAKKDGSVGT